MLDMELSLRIFHQEQWQQNWSNTTTGNRRRSRGVCRRFLNEFYSSYPLNFTIHVNNMNSYGYINITGNDRYRLFTNEFAGSETKLLYFNHGDPVNISFGTNAIACEYSYCLYSYIITGYC
jgi:hypothetical protein